jgi:hypothetical protein
MEKKTNIDIKSLEINLLKTSEINDNDTIIVKIDQKEKSNLDKEKISQIYSEIKNMIKKDIAIYFFPKNLEISIMKQHIQNIEKEKDQLK